MKIEIDILDTDVAYEVSGFTLDLGNNYSLDHLADALGNLPEDQKDHLIEYFYKVALYATVVLTYTGNFSRHVDDVTNEFLLVALETGTNHH